MKTAAWLSAVIFTAIAPGCAIALGWWVAILILAVMFWLVVRLAAREL